nr:MAG TPA: minor tail protein [Caudoviricetes sp.]
MADVDITSLSVEISAESQGAELNIDKLATAISNLRTKGNVTKVVNSLDKLSASISALKQASTGLSGLDNITNFLNGIGNANFSGSVKSINSVVNAIKKIPATVSGLNGVDFYSMSGSITELTNAMAPLSILDASGLKAIGSAVNAIGKIPDLSEKLKAADLDAFSDSCNKISTALTPLASQLDKVGNAFAKLPSQLSKVVTQANRVTAANEKQRKSYLSLSNQMNGFMRNMAKLVSLKAIAEYLGNAVAKFNDFYEATDLFHNAMGNLSGEADTLISKMQGLLGVDPTKAMTYMATIQSLGTSFGLTSDKAYILSKNLTQLAYDEGSYWNKDVAETFTAMSSAISGEIEPIRRLGVDLSQARLQQELLALGFNKQVSSLSQADKAVLRYIAIMKQTANVQGNLAQTIQSPANQIKILKAQLDMLAKSVGSLLYPALKAILPPLIAAVQLIREFVEWVAKLMGVKVVFTDFTKSADSVGGIGDAMDDTADSTKKAAKALKDYTMGFDELNIIDPTQGSSGSGGGASAGNILGDVDLSGYDMFKDYIGTTIDEVKAKLEKLAPLVAGIAAGFATWAIGNALMDALSKIKGDGTLIEGILKLWKSPIMGAAVAVGIMVARFVDLYQNSEAFRKGLERVQAMIYLAAEGLRQGWNISLTDGKLGESIKYLKESFSNLKQVIWNLIPESWQEGISSAFETISDVVKDLDLDVGDLITTLMGIGLIVSGHPVACLAVLGFEAITVAVRGLGSESQKESFEMETDWFNAFKSMGEKVADFVGNAITAIGNLINDFAIFIGWIQNGVSETDRLDLQMNGNFIENAVMGIAQLIHDVGVFVGWITNGVSETDRLDIQMNGNFIEKAVLGFADLINWVKDVVTWFVHLDEHVENGARAVRGFIDDIKTWAKDAAKAASDMVTAVANAIVSLPSKMFEAGKNIWQGLVNGIKSGIETAKGAAANLAKAIIDKFTTDTEIHSPSALFERFGKFINQGLANGITVALPYVEQAMTNLANVVQQKGNEMIDYGADVANGFVDKMVNTFDAKWNEIDNGLKSDFIGTIKGMIDAVKKGDIQTVAENTAAIIWKAMGEENRKQVKSYASDLVSNLTSALKTVGSKVFSSAKLVGNNILAGITSKFGEISTQVVGLGSKISTSFSALIGPISASGRAISLGLSSGVLSQFPSIIAGIAGLIGQIGAAFMGILQTIGSVLTSLGIPTGVIMIAGGVAIAAAIAGIVGTLVGKHGTSSAPSVNDSYSSYPGTSDYDSANGSTTSVGSYYPSSSASGASPEELRSAVHDGCYNAFLDIFQRYGDELTGGKELKIYLDGKQITASVEKRQSERGFQIMGDEVYSY